MNHRDILHTVVKHLLNEVEDAISTDDITIESRLRDDLNLNSLQAVNIIVELEDEFNISISEDELVPLVTVGDVVGIIRNKLGDKE
jgi:acyl carrier protein